MTPNWSKEELIEIWLAACEEPLDEERQAELNRVIVENPDIRERLIHLAQEQSWLMWNGTNVELADPVVQPLATNVCNWNMPPTRDIRRSRAQGGSIWSLAGALLLCALTILAVTQWTAPVTNNNPSAVAQDALLPGSTLRIDSGSATLALPKVGHVALEGPTELELVTPMRARLLHGRIRVRVSEATGYGFVVEYPNGKVTDLGTEFGLSVPPAGSDEHTSLVVFEGAVNLERSVASAQPVQSLPAQRLTRGEGVTISSAGRMDRVMSIVTGNHSTFDEGSDSAATAAGRVIWSVSDNLRSSDTRKFYEIVPGGFDEDALAYVDRPTHEWNGVTKKGLPRELIGADYIKTFGDDDTRTDLEIKIRLARPAKLFVLFDSRLPPPNWLKHSFQKTKDHVGIDLGDWPGAEFTGAKNEKGPGNSIDHVFDVWVRVVDEPGVVTLGANHVRKNPYMYGIAAVPLTLLPATNEKRNNDK